MSQTDRLHRRVSALKIQLERTDLAYRQALAVAQVWKDAFEELEVAAHANANVACGMAMEFGALQSEHEEALANLALAHDSATDMMEAYEKSSAGSAGDVGC